ncbi:hypothetical protein [Vibrio xiamenensis]|uniref:hypothetical protein n=1 Tax=Vibrio xiamenensis TaxID=861298 RepID=UPI0015A1B06B|nr:hypothetical protein [Vibrio xiamenensis]
MVINQHQLVNALGKREQILLSYDDLGVKIDTNLEQGIFPSTLRSSVNQAFKANTL